MTQQEFRAILDRLALTKSGAARLLGVHDVTVRRWATGAREIPPTVDRFLRFLDGARVSPDEVMAILDRA